MARFNQKSVPTVGPKSAIVSVQDSNVRTHEGGTGYTRDAKSELFLLAASFMGGDSNFYEKSDGRYERLIHLVSTNEVLNDPVWIYNFVKWLRTEANMRTVAMVVAIEAVRIRTANGMTDPFAGDKVESMPPTYLGRTNRDIVSVALNRGDEPAEALAYWLSKYGKPIIWPVKNGLMDAAIRLYDEYSYLKYGKSRSASVGMIDVLRLFHSTPRDAKQAALFGVIVGGDETVVGPETLPMIYNRKHLYSIAPEDRRSVAENPQLLRDAGMTWENISEWLPGGMDAQGWELAIPNMGIMALIRNLRNFDQAGISGDSRRYVMDKIMDRGVVEKSRQLPFRWYNAFRNIESLHYGMALEEALDMSLGNIPKFSGRTLVLTDMSGSMFGGRVSEKSSVTYADAASLFAAALKLRNPDGVDLYQYGSEFSQLISRYHGPDKRWTGVTKEIRIGTGASILRSMGKFHEMGGTETHRAFAELNKFGELSKYKRIILLTDEQSFRWDLSSINYDELPVPAGTNLYIWNFAGYKAGTSASGRYNRHTFGGLSDSAFKLIPLLEAGKNTGWPWEVEEEESLSATSTGRGKFRATKSPSPSPQKPGME